MPIRFLSNQTTDEDISLDGALTTGTTLSVGTTLTIGTIAQIGSDTDKFLMSDSGVVKYVDGATLRGYIGAGTGSGSVTGVGGTAPIVSSGGTAPDISITNATGTTVGACAIQSSGVGISVSDSNGVYSISNSGMISWTSRADSGSDISLGNGGVLDIAGGTGISTAITSGVGVATVTITNTSPNVAETFTEWVIRDDDDDDKTLSGSTNKYLKVTMANGTAGTNLSGTGTTADPYVLALTSPGDSGGTVTSVSGTGNVNGITLTDDGSSTTPTLTLGGTLSINNGDWSGTDLAVTNGGTGASTAAAAITNLGATTVGGNMFTLTNPSAITFPRFNANNTVDALSASDFRTAIGAGTGSGSMSSWDLAGDSGSTTIANGNTATIAGGTNITTAESGGTVTITNGITNNSQLTNGAGYTTNVGTVTGSGSSGRVAIWSTSSGLTSDSGLTFNTATDLLSVAGDAVIQGGEIFLDNQIVNPHIKLNSTALYFGDVNDADAIEQIYLKTMGASNITLEDGVINLNSADIQLPTSGEIEYNTNSKFDWDVGGSSGQNYKGEIIKLYSDTTVAGDVYNHSDFASGWTKADADSQNTKNMCAIAVGTSSSSGMLLRGVVRYSSGHGLTAGRPIYISNTAGDMTNTAPSGSSDYVRVIGYALNSNEIYFNPDNTWVQLSS